MADHWRLRWQPLPLRRWCRDGAQRHDPGLRLELDDPHGRQVAGEISPLPERRQSGADPLHGGHLQELQRQLESADLTAGRQKLERWLHRTACQHPCTAFALGSALWRLDQQGHSHGAGSMPTGAGTNTDAGSPDAEHPWPTVGLLPSGAAALTALERGLARGWRCWKWKIGALPWRQEQPLLAALLAMVTPVAGQLRLDANGRLDTAALSHWLEAAVDPRIGWLEQPLAPTDPLLERLLASSPIPGVQLALDESLAHLDQVEHLLRAPPASEPLLVVKPSQLGDPRRLAGLLRAWPGRCVVSSGFEGRLGQAVVHDLAKLAAAGGSPAPGLGATA
ncbi:enolase C-terminal domain-like protein [Candidatus Synechococcus spongiarum]|uniref:O-succinylbenzoate synthase n=1 Tax=Candidatus Synechococcus spongiarum TaxID=431041 RepID=A0A171DHC1_9SYNE|nr:enolase C-terminal domain-like protein [Candidatus Synechococcus spongiarum]SAY39188.1 O-succinylbenzoate synthase (EC 4.2.1.113) [Candidatus Synechococcus spongiarum]